MSFADDVERVAGPLRQAILSHPFVTGIGDGTLDVEKFKHYARQDYIYPERLQAGYWPWPRPAPPTWTQWDGSPRLLHETLNTEMDLHRGYCAQFGITEGELEATRASPTTLAYTNYLVAVAYNGSYPELAAAFLPCQWGYWEIGDHLARKGEPLEAPLYSQWIRMYVSQEYKALADWARSLANRLADKADPGEIARMEQAYITSTRYEYLFWDMAYDLESWPV